MKIKKETIEDIKGLSLGYLGVGLLSWWGLWSEINYGILFGINQIGEFFTTIGGIL